MKKTHDAGCLDNARICVIDNCSELLTAAAWDLEAVDAENTWILSVSLTWLEDGTKDCTCAAVTA